jgi:16S rRNA G1207 methylase RsmC
MKMTSFRLRCYLLSLRRSLRKLSFVALQLGRKTLTRNIEDDVLITYVAELGSGTGLLSIGIKREVPLEGAV